MPYGFILDSGFGAPVLERTHNGEGEGKRVIAINGASVLGKPRSEIREILNTQARARESVIFLLEGGNTVTFLPDSAKIDWQNTISTE